MISTRALVVAVALTVTACGGYAPLPSHSPSPTNSSPIQPLYWNDSGLVCTGRLPGADRVITSHEVPIPVLTRICGASFRAGYLQFE